MPDPHRDPHGEMSRERRRGYAWYPLRRSVFFAACSHHLCHEIAHLFGGAFLHLPRDLGVGAEREARIEMAEHSARETSCALRNSGSSSKFLMLDVFKVKFTSVNFRKLREITCVSEVPLLD